MDILDMPNTNKYSFEGWDNHFNLNFNSWEPHIVHMSWDFE